ncbi:hypothetical protein SEVIR_2G252450v4 [Setaria viridis]
MLLNQKIFGEISSSSDLELEPYVSAFGPPIRCARRHGATDTTPAGLIPRDHVQVQRPPPVSAQHQHARPPGAGARGLSGRRSSDFAAPCVRPPGFAVTRATAHGSEVRQAGHTPSPEKPAPARDMATPPPRARGQLPSLGVRAPTTGT